MSTSDKSNIEKRPNTNNTDRLEKGSVDKPTLTSRPKKETRPKKK